MKYGGSCKSDTICKECGRLYTWERAMKSCPRGWHVPTQMEWKTVTDFIGIKVGHKMKSTSGWNTIGSGDNSSGFNAIACSYKAALNPHHHDFGRATYFWTATELNKELNTNAYTFRISWDNTYSFYVMRGKPHGYSVRCVRD